MPSRSAWSSADLSCETHTQNPTRMEWSARCHALPLSPVDVTGWHTSKLHSLPILRTVATRNDMKRAPLLTGANFFLLYCFFVSRSASFLAAWANRTPGCFNVIIHTTSPSCSRIFRLMRHRRTHSPRLKNWGLRPTPLKWRNSLIGWNSSPIKQLAGEYRFKVFIWFCHLVDGHGQLCHGFICCCYVVLSWR